MVGQELEGSQEMAILLVEYTHAYMKPHVEIKESRY